MNKNYILIISLALFVLSRGFFTENAIAQSVNPDVIATTGDYFSNSTVSVAWTIGETIGETYTSANNSVTQGFHQPDYGKYVVGINELNTNSTIVAYPNPVTNSLTISFDDAQGKFLIEVFDVIGKRLSAETVEVNSIAVNTHTLAFGNYNMGVYLVHITGTAMVSKHSFTIIKN